MDPASIQHTQMILGMAIAFAMLGTLLLCLLGRWLGGSWTTLLATLTACLLAFSSLTGSTFFSRISTDLYQRTFAALIPFTAVLIGLSFKRIPTILHILFALIAPAILLSWVFYHYDVTVPRQTLFLHKILPAAGVIFAIWALLEPIAVRTPGVAAPMSIGFLSAGGAFLLLLSAENNAGMLAPLVSATAGGAVLAGLVASISSKPISLARGPILLWLTVSTSLFTLLWMSTDKLPLQYLCWLASVPLLAWIPEIGPIHRLKHWKRETLRFALLAIPVILTVIAAKKQHDKEAAESGDPFGMVWPKPINPNSNHTSPADASAPAELVG
jgi:hypothetical protein